MGTPLSYHQANVCVLYTVLLHQLRTRYTHRVTVMCGSRLFRSIETNSNERPHKFHFSLQIGFFKCCYCCVPYFLRLIMCKRKGVFFFSSVSLSSVAARNMKRGHLVYKARWEIESETILLSTVSRI